MSTSTIRGVTSPVGPLGWSQQWWLMFGVPAPWPDELTRTVDTAWLRTTSMLLGYRSLATGPGTGPGSEGDRDDRDDRDDDQDAPADLTSAALARLVAGLDDLVEATDGEGVW